MNKLKAVCGLVCFLLATSFQAVAQYDYSEDLYYDNKITYEIGSSLGLMNCLTDLGGKEGLGKNFVKDLNLEKSQFTGSIYLSAAYKYALAVRAEVAWGKVTANDADLFEVRNTTPGRYGRNLSFQSKIFDFSLITELHPRYFKKYGPGEQIPRFSPYIFGGIGFFSFNPQAKLNDVWVDLQPLSTEGQGFAEYPNRKPYKLKQLNFPVGGGLKYKITPEFTISTELVYRILTTDYLDDVSTRYIDPAVFANHFAGGQLNNALALHDRQGEINPAHTPQPNANRGNSNNNDAYFSLNFKLGYIF